MPASEGMDLQEEVDQLKGMVAELARDVVHLSAQQEANTVRPWLATDDEELGRYNLADLVGWVRDVWSCYPGALPDCWYLHPWVLEELWTAMGSWRACQRKGGGWAAFADWHGRIRPGVAERLSRHIGGCGLDVHASDYSDRPPARFPLALPVDIDVVADAWTTHRTSPPSAAGHSESHISR